MKKLAYIFAFLLLIPFGVKAQYAPQFNQYYFNPILVNPAYAGTRGMLSMVGVHRSQWVGFDGAPSTQSFAIHSPSRRKNMGYGFQLMNDRIGPKNTIAVSGIYSYKLRVGRGKLGLGLRASLYNYTFDWSKIDYRESGGYALNQGRESYLTPSFDFGLYYNDKLNYVGMELSHLNQGRLGVEAENVNIESTSRQNAQMILVGGRAFKINRELIFKPSTLIRLAIDQPAFFDLNASFLMRNRLWLGASYRRGYGLVLVSEYNIDKSLRVGYSYDIATTTLSQGNAGSHEIFIGYDINVLRSRIVSPRYF